MDKDVQNFIDIDDNRPLNCLILDIIKYEEEYTTEFGDIIKKFKDLFITKEVLNSIEDYTPITDFSEINLYRFYYDDNIEDYNVIILFKDQNNNLRCVEITEEIEVPGMLKYCDKFIEIKNDLIILINQGFEWKQYLEEIYENSKNTI